MVTDSPDTPTAPDELVQAVHDATAEWYDGDDGIGHIVDDEGRRRVLAAVPDGWAKIDGKWVQVPLWRLRTGAENAARLGDVLADMERDQ